ncbi:MAG: cytochrome c family protein [candidate division Zixibacteria bacterium]|nr:cytochrome c family protein [candidate division Zixibacteria bacterium]
MKKLILILILVVVASFLVFGFVFSQGEKGTSEADTVKKETAKEDSASVADTTKKETAKEDSASVADTAKKETAKEDTTKVVHKYIGTFKCKMCHNSEKKGKIYDTWAATKHATAYKTLASDESKAIAKKMGIKDAQKDKKCLKCHVTGYGEPAEDKYSMEEGVTCEACHGPGEHYWSMKIMKDKKLAMEKGLVEPTEELCMACHNKESPTFKAIKYEEAYKQVEHHPPPPEKK